MKNTCVKKKLYNITIKFLFLFTYMIFIVIRTIIIRFFYQSIYFNNICFNNEDTNYSKSDLNSSLGSTSTKNSEIYDNKTGFLNQTQIPQHQIEYLSSYLPKINLPKITFTYQSPIQNYNKNYNQPETIPFPLSWSMASNPTFGQDSQVTAKFGIGSEVKEMPGATEDPKVECSFFSCFR